MDILTKFRIRIGVTSQTSILLPLITENNMSRQAHLIGSIGLESAEVAMTKAAEILGPCCSSIPDGETGERGYWIRWQQSTFDNSQDLQVEIVNQKLPGFKDAVQRPFYKIKPGCKPNDIDLGELGYAKEALSSYKIFQRLVADGKIDTGTRFQVCLPTPMALVCGFIISEDQLNVEPAIEKAMIQEIAQVQANIPAHKLALQWDVCFEVVGSDGGPKLPYNEPISGTTERLARLIKLIDDSVDLIIHFCYGDPGHKHIVDPKDLETSVKFANAISAVSPRRIDAIHMPVMRNRTDETYFKPLKNLDIPDHTKLILGLVHFTDGVEGGKARMATANKFVDDYGIATECGFGRRDPDTILELLQIHRDLCS